MRTTINYTFIVVGLFLLAGCAPSRYVKPLQKKQSAASFSFGGPLIKFSGAPIPVPFTTLGYGYGVSDKTTAYANLHTTSLLFGNLQADMGATMALLKENNKFGVSVSPALQIAYNLRNQTGFRVWPSLDLNAYYHPGKKISYAYAGINTWFEFSKVKAHNEKQQRHALPALHLGYTVVKTKFSHQFELSYMAPGIPNLPGVVDYIGISGKGTLGIHYALIRRF